MAQVRNTLRAPSIFSKQNLKCFLSDSDGAALVEFALVLPVLFLLFFGLVGWGYSLTLTDNMYDAARQAARELAAGSADEVQAKSSAEAALAAWPATFDVVAQDSDTTGSGHVHVTITAANIMSNSLSFLPLASTLEASVIMRGE